MGKIAEIKEMPRDVKRMWRILRADCNTTYSLNVFGMRIKGNSVWIYALFPVFISIAYVACAVSLYAFDTLLGIPEFSWTNAFWWMIVLATFMATFNGGD